MNKLSLLQQMGYWQSPAVWGGINGLRNHLQAQPSYTGHVYASGDRIARSLEDSLAQTGKDQNAGYSCYRMDDILRAPGLLDFLFSFDALATGYFEEEPRLYSINAFWKKPAADADWHFDQDDRKVMVLFMYGTDILAPEDGPHAYIKCSHLWPRETKDMLHKSGLSPGKSLIQEFYGPKGTFFLTDTNGMHIGHHPKEKPRLLIWARWGVSNPPHAYTEDKLCPVPASLLPILIEPTPALKSHTSLVVDWNR